MSRIVAAWLCCTALVCGLACGKYGRPERLAPSSSAVSASADAAPATPAETPDASDDGDKKKSPKR
ncbi:MAG TPA: hypothetical protein EYG46_12000 [Myxococcales bacterium]|jgi:hypothetical protein|nr:hypothetical protein [Myxococcales bacterium]HIM01704.1 hypothetical protein [Myxococcales bacterium]